jgi:isopenicillin N synthase-like dioxygenase
MKLMNFKFVYFNLTANQDMKNDKWKRVVRFSKTFFTLSENKKNKIF